MMTRLTSAMNDFYLSLCGCPRFQSLCLSLCRFVYLAKNFCVLFLFCLLYNSLTLIYRFFLSLFLVCRLRICIAAKMVDAMIL